MDIFHLLQHRDEKDNTLEKIVKVYLQLYFKDGDIQFEHADNPKNIMSLNGLLDYYHKTQDLIKLNENGEYIPNCI